MHRALALLLSAAAIAACSREPAPAGNRLVIGIVAKSQSNPVFQAAHAGALAAGRELASRYGVEVAIDIQTPPDESPEKQAQAIEQLARAGVRGIAVSCSDANTLTAAIDRAIELGSQVVCFDSDAPRSRRFAYFGTDDRACGAAVMAELARALGDQGTIAILAGNQAAPNLQQRVQGVKDELSKHAGLKLLDDGVFYHPETPEQAAEALNRAQSANPEIGGWALIGGWPLFTRDALKWPAGSVKVVSVDALPAQLPYLESGHVAVLLAQNCYGWGYRAVELLLEKIVKGVDPAGAPILYDPLTPVLKDGAKAYGAKWDAWLKED